MPVYSVITSTFIWFLSIHCCNNTSAITCRRLKKEGRKKGKRREECKFWIWFWICPPSSSLTQSRSDCADCPSAVGLSPTHTHAHTHTHTFSLTGLGGWERLASSLDCYFYFPSITLSLSFSCCSFVVEWDGVLNANWHMSSHTDTHNHSLFAWIEF